MKRRITAVLVTFVILISAFGAAIYFASRPEYKGYSVLFLKEYNIRIGDTPRAVAKKEPGTLTGEMVYTETPLSDYEYDTTVLGREAQVTYEFFEDKYLSGVSAVIRVEDREEMETLFEEARGIIAEAYKGNRDFWSGEIVQRDNGYKISIGLWSGAISLIYDLTVADDVFTISVDDME